MKKKIKGKHPPTDTGVTTGRRLGWIRAKEYKLADDATLQKILNPPPPSGPEFKPEEYISGVVDDSRLLYKCHDCGALFTSEINLRCHATKHLNPNLKCTFCGRLSKTEEEFTQHCKEFHPDLKKTPGVNPLKCMKCNKISRDVTALWRHIRESHRPTNYPCPYCEFPFTRPENLKSHIRYKHFKEVGEKEPPKFKCKICEKVFDYQNTLRGHIRQVHRGKPEKRFQCKICKSSYSCKSSYAFHLRQHTNPTFYPCQICNVTFKTQGKLNRHNQCKSHILNSKRAKRKPQAPFTGSTPVIKTVKSINPNLSKEQLIELCKNVAVKIKLKRIDEFVVRRYPKAKGSSTSKSDKDDDDDDGFTSAYLNCCYCDKAFPDLEAVKSHEKNCYMKLRTPKINVCPICDKEFEKPYLLRRHTQKHLNPNERPFKCTHCDATFRGRSARATHEKKFHFGIFRTYQRKYHKCEECGKVYNCITSYKNHRDAVHIGIRYTCKECGKVFRRTDHFSKHIRKNHQCPLRLECKHCNRSYVDKRAYLNHLLKPRHLRKVKQFEKMVQKEK